MVSSRQQRHVEYRNRLRFAAVDSFVFAATNSNGVFRSTDIGANWGRYVLIAGIEPSIQFGRYGFRNSRRHQCWLYRSTNKGTNWQAANAGMGNHSVWSLAITPGSGGGFNLFACTTLSGTYKGGVFLSTNGGSSWRAVNNGLVDSSVYALAVGSPSSIYAGTFGHGVSLSTDNGASWQSMNNGLSNLKVITLAVPPGGPADSNVFAGTFGGGLFLSTNSGTSWSAIGLPGLKVNALAVSSLFIFAGIDQGGGVWLRPLSDVVSVEEFQHLALKGFALEQNYPNPFNPSTTISYQLPVRSHVNLKIYDLLGREVAEVFDGEQTSGRKSITWDAAAFSSGIYFYRLTIGGFSDVKKLVLVK